MLTKEEIHGTRQSPWTYTTFEGVEVLCDTTMSLYEEIAKWKAIAKQINTDWIPANQKLSAENAALKQALKEALESK